MQYNTFENILKDIYKNNFNHFEIKKNYNILEISNYPDYVRMELTLEDDFFIYDINISHNDIEPIEYTYTHKGQTVFVDKPYFIEEKILNFVNDIDGELIDYAY